MSYCNSVKYEIKQKIIIMNKQYAQEDECFQTTQNQQHQTVSQNMGESILISDIRSSLPQANQLINHCRPTEMVSRILVTEGQIQCLPIQLDEACQEVQMETNINNTKVKISNREKLPLADYLLKKQIYPIFTKYQQPIFNSLSTLAQTQPKKSINEMTNRIRIVSQASDYNSKQFKQLLKYEPNIMVCGTNQSDMVEQDKFVSQKKTKRHQDKIDSNFQCGNLAKAYAHTDNQNAYYLLLEQDTNTHGYTNWFFYRVRNMGIGIRRFYILNLVKRTKFYKNGMKISIFSMKKYQNQGIKWFKGGNNISFFQTSFARQQHSDFYNCLYFQYNFQHQNDEVYFASSQPYTYTRLSNLFKSVGHKAKGNQIINWKIQTVGFSISNNIIPAITFYSKNEQQEKKTIVILGRQHPSEVAGSFISEYLIRFFADQNQDSLKILKKYNVLIIPMINPDGVIYGNSRNNLCGFDLNRHWGADAIKQLTPETHRVRSLLCQLQKNKNDIKFLLDIHGHGKKLNSFLFCCRKQDRISNRIFPLMMSKIQKRLDLASCTYGISRDKQNTIRAQLYDIGINDCYTLQNSYFGYCKNKQQGQISSYNEKDYQSIAESIIKSLLVFLSSQKNQKQNMKQKFGFNLDTVYEQLTKIVDRLERQQKNILYDQDIMSQSDPQGDGLRLQQRLKICTNNKILDKKIRQSFKKNKLFTSNKSKNTKKIKTQGNQNLKTQQQIKDDDDDNQQINLKVLQQKIQSKLVLSKKLKIQNKIRASTRQRKSILQTKKKQQNEQKIVKKVLNKSFNPFQIPKQSPVQFSKSQYVNSNKSGNKTQNYEKCKIYQKLKTQIQEKLSFSAVEIQMQNERKQKFQVELTKLKQQNLKNVVKQSLLFMGTSLKSKKCKWVDDKKYRNLASNHIIEAKFYAQNSNTQDTQKPNLKQQKSEADFNKKKKIFRTTTQQSLTTKTQSEPKKAKPKRSYQRFQTFVQNIPIPSIQKFLKESKGSVFYRFPVM